MRGSLRQKGKKESVYSPKQNSGKKPVKQKRPNETQKFKDSLRRKGKKENVYRLRQNAGKKH